MPVRRPQLRIQISCHFVDKLCTIDPLNTTMYTAFIRFIWHYEYASSRLIEHARIEYASSTLILKQLGLRSAQFRILIRTWVFLQSSLIRIWLPWLETKEKTYSIEESQLMTAGVDATSHQKHSVKLAAGQLLSQTRNGSFEILIWITVRPRTTMHLHRHGMDSTCIIAGLFTIPG